MHEVCSGFSRHKLPRFRQPRGILLGSVLPSSTFEVPCLVQPRLRFCLLPGLAPLGVMSEVCSGFSRFKQLRGISQGSVLPSSILEVPCLVQPRLCFCLLPGLAPQGVMSEVCSGSSRLKQSRGTLLGSASPVLLFCKRASGFPPLGVVSDFFFRKFPPVFLSRSLPGLVLA